MGGDSSQQTQQQNQQTSSTAPWGAAMPEIQGLLGGLQGLMPGAGVTTPESGAIAQMTASGQAGNPYAPAVGNVATTLLGGGGATSEVPFVNANYKILQGNLSPYLSPTYSTVNSPDVRAALDQVATDTGNDIRSQFAAAGRSGSGMETQTLGRGIAAAEAPIILNQANQDTATRLGAAGTLYGAGNTTAGTVAGMNQQGVTNQEAGIPAASSALDATNWGPQQTIQAQELLKSLPAGALGMLAQIGIPLASLGSTSTGQSTGQSSTQGQMSGAQQFMDIMQGIGSLGNLWKH